MDHRQRVWDILESTGVGMLTTRFDGGMRSRPLDARPDRSAGRIFFIVDVRGLKDDEIAACPDVCFIMINAQDKAYLSITGRAEVLEDRQRAAMIWKASDEIWWSGPDDENVRVLRLEPHIAELWDGPSSSAVVRHEFLMAHTVGKKPDLGENRKTTVDMT